MTKQTQRKIFLIAFCSFSIMFFLVLNASYIKGSKEADALTLLNQSSQILSAVNTFHEENGRLPETLDELVGERFLIEMPDPTPISGIPYAILNPERYVFVAGKAENFSRVCNLVEEQTRKKQSSVVAKCTSSPKPDDDGMLLMFKPI